MPNEPLVPDPPGFFIFTDFPGGMKDILFPDGIAIVLDVTKDTVLPLSITSAFLLKTPDFVTVLPVFPGTVRALAIGAFFLELLNL